MVNSCAAYKCKNRFKKGELISFHIFPLNPILREKWVKATGRKNFTPSSSSKLCSIHFKDDDFVQKFVKKNLRSNVVPSLFNNYPKEQKITITNEVIIKEEPTIKEELYDLNDPLEMDDLPELNIIREKIKSYQTRKRILPIYMRDVTAEQLEHPEKFKILWNMAKETLDKKTKTVLNLRIENRRLKQQVELLTKLTCQLQNK